MTYNKNIVITILSMIASISLFGCIDSEKKVQARIDALKVQCDQLTQESNGERVYETVVGQYVVEKSRVAIVNVKGQTSKNIIIVLRNENGDRRLQTLPEYEDTFQKTNASLNEAVKDSLDNKAHQKRLYGVCAYKLINSFIIETSTITKIKG